MSEEEKSIVKDYKENYKCIIKLDLSKENVSPKSLQLMKVKLPDGSIAWFERTSKKCARKNNLNIVQVK